MHITGKHVSPLLCLLHFCHNITVLGVHNNFVSVVNKDQRPCLVPWLVQAKLAGERLYQYEQFNWQFSVNNSF